ncbi:MAG: 1-acyl-sn-glycerol-3-phosphate acyltransferase [Gemmatimonas sp.]
MLHPIVRWLARRSIRWLYANTEFVGAEKIPASGATLIVASHGNDLPDILLTFLASNRDILFVANITAAEFPIARWTYAGLGVIPISRVRDARALKARGLDASALNADAFSRVVDALKAGHIVAIFPEGMVPEYPRLGALRNGAAKMALQAIDEGVPLTMVPIGYQYESAHTLRSDTLAVVGEVVAVQEWKPRDATRRVSEFTAFMAERLCAVTRNARTYLDADVLSAVAATVGAAVARPGESPLAAAHRVQRRLSQLSAADGIFVAHAIAPAAIDLRETVESLEQLALQFVQMSSAFGVRSWSARDQYTVQQCSESNSETRLASSFTHLLLSPFALVGAIVHAVPWVISRAVARKYAPRDSELAAITIVPGLYIVVLWYVAVAIAVAATVSPWLALPVLIVLPRLGDAAMHWRDRMHTFRLRRALIRSAEHEKERLRELARMIRRIWETIDQGSPSTMH